VLRYDDLTRGTAIVTIDRGQPAQMVSGPGAPVLVGTRLNSTQGEAAASQASRRPSLNRIPVVRIETVSEHSRVARMQQATDSQLPQRPIPLYEER
jgi:hypothetical protein